MKDPRYSLAEYDYPLPEERIARFPLKERDRSKLLVYNKGNIMHEKFCRIPEILPGNSFLVFNETKVIPARIGFEKSSGAHIEIFLLDPVLPSTDAAVVLKSREDTIWHCMIRNVKKWKEGIVLEKMIGLKTGSVTLRAELADHAKSLVRFSWDDGQILFGEILEATGKVPLPPYLRREPVSEDRERYQTVYSKHEGAVAAPTAGLHFTETMFSQLAESGFTYDFLTLHVSAGTFQPIRHNDIRKHAMHGEQINVSARILKNLLDHDGPVIAVGTTAMRTLESLYWYGLKLIRGIPADGIEPLFPYRFKTGELPLKNEVLHAVLDHMEKNNLDEIHMETRIFIFPGYNFRIPDGLITNFHLPKSTLLLLISAFIGDEWKKVYDEALKNGYRFLSYGDSSLLIP